MASAKESDVMSSNELPSEGRNQTIMIGQDRRVGRMGFGAMQLTGPKVWGDYPDRDKGMALLNEVVAAGVTFIDTADVYGPHSNELLIHDALHPYPDDLVIATKGGFVRGGPEYTEWDAVGNRVYLRQCVYTSLRRLGLDRIDLYYLHSPNATDVPFEAQVETLAEMRQEGLIKHIGLSNVSAEQFLAARAIVDIAAVTAHYNIGVRLGAALMRATQAAGVMFSPWHPGALPTGDAAASCLAVLEPLAEKHNATVHQIALAWQLHRSPLTLPIPGTTSITHMKENLAARSIELAPNEVDDITALLPEPAGNDG
jgi:pyridoxine 4-dehydrogenase